MDFLIKSQKGSKHLIQVAFDSKDEKTLAREERALMTAEKELKIKGQIITLDLYLKNGIILNPE